VSTPFFVRLGLSTPLGLHASATVTAISAGLTGFDATEVVDESGAPVRASRLKGLDPTLPREERILALGRRALAECLGDLDARRSTSVACYIALPEKDARPFDEAYVMQTLSSAAAHLPLDWSARPIRAGRAGVFLALEAAAAAIASGKTPVALVGGLDSHCDAPSLEHLADAGRTLGASNSDGLIPGEAGGFLLLARHDAAAGHGLPHGKLVACASARDVLPFDKRNAMLAIGLTTMFRHLRARAGQPRPQRLYSCQTGESFWARELNHAYLRNATLMPEPFVKSTVAESLGDCGAGAGIVELAMAFASFKTSWRRGAKVDRAIVYGAADEGAVGGCIVSG
jgi:3-oxoacyl-[acyl-carrier-protein] synthase I